MLDIDPANVIALASGQCHAHAPLVLVGVAFLFAVFVCLHVPWWTHGASHGNHGVWLFSDKFLKGSRIRFREEHTVSVLKTRAATCINDL